MNYKATSDLALLAELGVRFQRERLNQNLPQAGLADRAGLSRRALQNLESGRGCTLASLVRVLRALDKLDALDGFLPAPTISPVQLAHLKGSERQRASGPRKREGSSAK